MLRVGVRSSPRGLSFSPCRSLQPRSLAVPHHVTPAPPARRAHRPRRAPAPPAEQGPLASKRVRQALVQPQLSSDVHFRFKHELGNLVRTPRDHTRWAHLRRAVASLAAAPERCRLVRRLVCAEHSAWMRPVNERLFAQIDTQADDLEEAGIERLQTPSPSRSFTSKGPALPAHPFCRRTASQERHLAVLAALRRLLARPPRLGRPPSPRHPPLPLPPSRAPSASSTCTTSHTTASFAQVSPDLPARRRDLVGELAPPPCTNSRPSGSAPRSFPTCSPSRLDITDFDIVPVMRSAVEVRVHDHSAN